MFRVTFSKKEKKINSCFGMFFCFFGALVAKSLMELLGTSTLELEGEREGGERGEREGERGID
jgi:hypothetical protein